MDRRSPPQTFPGVARPALPAGGGAIQRLGQSFTTHEFSGTSGWVLPLPVSPCRGFEPKLALEYGSAYGNGPWGLGFELSLPRVERQTRYGVPHYDGTDAFVLSGADLVPADEAPRSIGRGGKPYQVRRYLPRHQAAFPLVEHWQSEADVADSFWQVTSADHITSIFGKTAHARIFDPEDPSRLFGWLLEECFDDRGDHQVYVYKGEDTTGVPDTIYEQGRRVGANRYLDRIRYGNEKPVAGSLLLEPTVEAALWHFEVVFSYGDYDIDPANTDPYRPARPWVCRLDSHSSYETGFERRTHRLCDGVLMFHCFPDELGPAPVLTGVTSFVYRSNRARISELSEIAHQGYHRDVAGGPYRREGLPSVRLSYTPFSPEDYTCAAMEGEAGPLTGATERSRCAVVDLRGEGRPGILYSDGDSVLYREPKPVFTTTSAAGIAIDGAAVARDSLRYEPWQPLPSFPVGRQVDGDPRIRLGDPSGDGRLHMISEHAFAPGYWEAARGTGWSAFHLFSSFPADRGAPGTTWVDATGDGVADRVQLAAGHVRINPAIPPAGVGGLLVAASAPEMPVSANLSPSELVAFADIDGSGAAHLVRVRNGEVAYWPSLGYGCFGPTVRMDNAPRFDGAFDPGRLFLADLDGSGTADLIYLERTCAHIFFNASGNGFSDAFVLPLPGACSDVSQVRFADLYGRGNQCLVMEEPDADSYPRLWCVDFCGGTKPYLLEAIDNGLGGTTEITYGTSVEFFEADRVAELPWVTQLPFPVHVVKRVTRRDGVTGTRYDSHYAYHHGYFDGIERQFRGFARVDRQDTTYVEGDGPGPPPAAPSLTRTWYHTGAFLDDADLRHQLAGEFFTCDAAAFPFEEDHCDFGDEVADGETRRQAAVALAGAVLRTEVYGLDDNEVAGIPYAVTESSFLVRLVQARAARDPVGEAASRYAVFFTHPRQTLHYDYERDPADPRIVQHTTLCVDSFGNVLRSCELAYPRRTVSGRLSEQQELRVLCEVREVHNEAGEEGYLLGIEIEHRVYEIAGIVTPLGAMLTTAELDVEIAAALSTIGPDQPSSLRAELRGARRTYYAAVGDAGSTVLPLGQVVLPLRVGRLTVAEFSQAQAEDLFKGVLDADALKAQLHAAQYDLEATSGLWWRPGSTAYYAPLAGFCQPASIVDPAGNATAVRRDPHHLLVIEVKDALGNAVSGTKLDYQHLAPLAVIDRNGNVDEVKLDPMGRVRYRSHRGHEAGEPAGFAPVSEAPTAVPTGIDELIAKAATYLGKMESFAFYDPFAWRDRGQPPVAVVLKAQRYPDSRGEGAAGTVEIYVGHTDGLGRRLQEAQKVEPGEAFVYDPGTGSIRRGHTDHRWRVSGHTVYNNKGLPVRKYEPYFLDTYVAIEDPLLATFGVSPTLYYDPLNRLAQAVSGKGFVSRIDRSAWGERLWDHNDTLVSSPYYRANVVEPDPASPFYDPDLDAAGKAILEQVIATCSETPTEHHLDNLGHLVQTVEYLREPGDTGARALLTRRKVDILGRLLSVSDPRLGAGGHENLVFGLSLTGVACKMASVDSGPAWRLENAAGLPVFHCDGRQIQTSIDYDALLRPVSVHVEKSASERDPLVLNQVVERWIYGDTPGALPDPKPHNLVGQVFRHFDPAGLVEVPDYSLLAAPLRSSRRLCADPTTEVAWDDISPEVLAKLLERTTYTETFGYDAEGRLLAHADPDGNRRQIAYYVSGHLSRVTVTPAAESAVDVVAQVDYNARGQRRRIRYGNDTVTDYEYDPRTFSLAAVQTVNRAKLALQGLRYRYDPAENVVQQRDDAAAALPRPGFAAGSDVPPVAAYTYDSLYRLARATGREAANPTAEAVLSLQGYVETYKYDEGGNLVRIDHAAPAHPWTEALVVANRSNRAVSKGIAGADAPLAPGDVDDYFDPCGNQVQTEALASLRWSYRNSLACCETVAAGDGSTQELYVYDGGGRRARRITERYGKDGKLARRAETRYLGGLEIRRATGPTGEVLEELHALRIADDEAAVATRDLWVAGKPPGDFDSPCWRYHLADHLGSSTVDTNADGAAMSREEFRPYGATALFAGSAAAAAVKDYRYSGQERDRTTGLYYYNARYYAPWLGRWLSPDPIGIAAGLNEYAFVQGNPTTWADIGGYGPSDDEEEPEPSTKRSRTERRGINAQGRAGRGRQLDPQAQQIGSEIASRVPSNADPRTLPLARLSDVLTRLANCSSPAATNVLYRRLDRGADELLSTSAVRNLVAGVGQQHARSAYLNRLFGIASDARIPTRYSGHSTSGAVMQHPTGEDEGFFVANSSGAAASRHSRMDTDRRRYAQEAMMEVVTQGGDAAAIMFAGLRAAIRYTLNRFTAPITASNVQPHSVMRNVPPSRHDLVSQIMAREAMKRLYYQLSGRRPTGRQGLTSEWGTRSRSESPSPPRSVPEQDKAKKRRGN